MEEAQLLLLVLLVLVPLLLGLECANRNRAELPPGPYPLPLLGNFLQLQPKPHIALANLAKLHGPLMSVKLGSKLVVIGSSHEAAVELLKVHDRVVSGRGVPRTLFHVVSRGINTTTLIGATECTDNWKMMRTITRSALFSSKAIQSGVALREEKVKVLIDFLRSKKGEVVKIGEALFIASANTISRLIFSKDLFGLEDEEKVGDMKSYVRWIDKLVSTPNLGDYYPVFEGLDVQGLGKKLVEIVETFFASWEVLIDGRRESTSEDDTEKDFLGVLLASGLDKDQINWFVTELFVTSIDTSNTAVEWTMSELIKNQESMTKLREELTKEIGERIVRDSDLPRLPYLNACVKETLRLHPPVPIIHRRTTETCHVMNYTIPKGTQVWVNLWALGRDPAKWEDPFRFNPSRFMGSSLDFMGSNYDYLPFGTGKRMCPGVPLAARMIPLMVASLVHAFVWDLPDGINPTQLDMNEKFGITLQREKPLLLVPKPKAQ